MVCKLLSSIKHDCEYNTGGINELLLLDYEDFKGYIFRDDKSFDSCIVERVHYSSDYIELATTGESTFTESNSKGIYTQQLITFVRNLSGEKLRSLLLAKNRRYVIVFKNNGQYFTFGSDGGAKLSFTQITGTESDGAGYEITIDKQSIYPLFEVNRHKQSMYWILDYGKWEGDAHWQANGVWKTI